MESNPKGFYESGLFADMDDKILAKAGGFWDLPPKKERILKLKKDKRLNEEIKKLIKSQERKIGG